MEVNHFWSLNVWEPQPESNTIESLLMPLYMAGSMAIASPLLKLEMDGEADAPVDAVDEEMMDFFGWRCGYFTQQLSSPPVWHFLQWLQYFHLSGCVRLQVVHLANFLSFCDVVACFPFFFSSFWPRQTRLAPRTTQKK